MVRSRPAVLYGSTCAESLRCGLALPVKCFVQHHAAQSEHKHETTSSLAVHI